MSFNKEWLVQKYPDTEAIPFLFFWGHQPARDGSITRSGSGVQSPKCDVAKRFLVATGEHVLVEASPVDPVWGIGLAADHPAASKPLMWKGENLLGFALMEVREKLRG